MSPELKDYYRTKQRRMAFYIVENDINNKETPPDISAVIGRDIELQAAFFAARRPPLEKPAISAGMRVNRDITIKREIGKKNITKKNGMHCPSLPTQWKNSLDIIIPKAEFAY